MRYRSRKVEVSQFFLTQHSIILHRLTVEIVLISQPLHPKPSSKTPTSPQLQTPQNQNQQTIIFPPTPQIPTIHHGRQQQTPPPPPPPSLNVVVGRLIFSDNGDMIDCTKMGMGGKTIPPNIDRVGDMQSDALFILLVENDAAYMRLAEDRFYNRFPCIIVMAKGQPDVSTRLFLRKMKTELKLPVLALVDSDPYGLKILSAYGCGSKNMSCDSSHVTIPDIKWLGVRPSDLDKYKIPEQYRLPMTEQDIKTGKDMLEEDFVKKNPGWVEELTLMVKTKQKAEIEALSTFGFRYLTEVYLPLKLQQRDWL